ncbi:MAG: signal peptidase II [Ruminococcaceae bacterium]|nr:signal peptidase II [Oscillospiraceae bacterium]
MFLWIAIMVLAIFLDQLTKYLTILFLKPIDTLPIIEDVVHLTYVENTGAAFGMMKDQRWLFMVVSTVAIIALLIYLFRKKTQSKLENLAIAFIVGGGIGNMIDRVVLGYVVDMIDFRLINFAVFNVADSFVCVGAGLLMLYIILTGVKEYKEEKARKLALAEGEEDTDGLDYDEYEETLADTEEAEDEASLMKEDELESPSMEVNAEEPTRAPSEDETHE